MTGLVLADAAAVDLVVDLGKVSVVATEGAGPIFTPRKHADRSTRIRSTNWLKKQPYFEIALRYLKSVWPTRRTKTEPAEAVVKRQETSCLVVEEWVAAAAVVAAWDKGADKGPPVAVAVVTMVEVLVPEASVSVPDAARRCLIREARNVLT